MRYNWRWRSNCGIRGWWTILSRQMRYSVRLPNLRDSLILNIPNTKLVSSLQADEVPQIASSARKRAWIYMHKRLGRGGAI